MILADTYNKVLNIVSNSMGVDCKSIISSNKEEHVDARYILIQVLCDIGFTDAQIALLTGLTRACLSSIKGKFRIRQRKFFVNAIYKEVKNEVLAEIK